MSGHLANCPNCGAQLSFKAGASLLAICSSCDSAVARAGGDITELEILGKVAPLIDLGSPLSLGTHGKYNGKGFTLVGRVQLDWGAGPWNEWYAAMDDGQWAWLAEAQGKVYLTFGRPAEQLPPYGHWNVGTHTKVSGMDLVVVERRKAKFVTGEGELPFAVAPGSLFRYADLEGPSGIFGTLDFGTGEAAETLFIGRQVEYPELFTKDVLREPAQPRGAGAATVGLNCPSCGATVGLRAPDEAQRVTCPSCNALLDCNQGNALFLLQSVKRPGPAPKIALGAIGQWQGSDWTIYGHLLRSVTVEGVRYPFEEYLLKNDKLGYRWLVESDGHWSWVEPARAGDVKKGSTASYHNKTFRHFQTSSPVVEAIRGEFYWKIAIGERVQATDYIDPPRMLSEESSAEETVWSLGTYLAPAEVEKIWKLKQPLKKPHGVAPNQPNPIRGRSGPLKLAPFLTVGLILLGMSLSNSDKGQPVFSTAQQLVVPPADAVATPGSDKDPEASLVVLTPSFEIERRTNLEINLSSDVSNSWLFLNGALINETSNEVRQFGIEASYYYGVEDGESWSEGSRSESIQLGSVEPGNYLLRFQPEWQKQRSGGGVPPTSYSVSVRSGVFMLSHLIAAMLLIWLVPLWMMLRSFAFEKRRWAESDHAGS